MLSLSALSGGQEHYYLDLATEDYYLNGGEPPGRWYGRGAKYLGLDGEVAKDALVNVLDAQSPDGRTALGQVQRYSDGRERQPGWDLTFSAPKSVSTLWSQAHEALRGSIQAAHEGAAREALDYLQDVAACTRRGKGGERIEKADLVFALFEHGTSRAQDPQLHTHVLVPNVGRRDDGSWGAIRSRDLYQHKMAAGALYRTELAHRLSQLGLAIEPDKHSFRLRSVPRQLDEAFSTRRAEIQAALEEKGLSGAKASELLAKSTRQVKEHVAREFLAERWRGIGRAAGFSAREANALFGQAPSSLSDEEARRTIRQACGRATETLVSGASVFGERELVAKVASQLEAKGVSAKVLLQEVRTFLSTSTKLVRLDSDVVPALDQKGDAGRNGQQERSPDARTVPTRERSLFSTLEMVEAESRLIANAEASRGSLAHLVDKKHVNAVLAADRELRGEQRRALVYLTRSQGSIKCLSGMAGTGKTRLLRAARSAWEKQGFTVVGCAIAARAAAELTSGAKIQSTTVKSLLHRYAPTTKDTIRKGLRGVTRAAKANWKAEKFGRFIKSSTRGKFPQTLNSKTILVVDEAGMVGTRQMEQLQELARKTGAKLVLTGDERQLQPIDAGAAFRKLGELLGRTRLSNIQRQREAWMRQAIVDFAAGDARSGLSAYATRGHLAIADTKQGAVASLVQDWMKHRTERLSESLILAGTKLEVEALNRKVQAARIESGEIGRGLAAKEGGSRYHVGDRIVFTANRRRLGFLNGDFGIVESVKRRTLTGTYELGIRLDREGVDGLFSRPVRVTVRLAANTPIALGYATTTHKSQGATVDRCFVLAGGWMQDREISYVQMSRHRDQCQIYATTAEAGEDLSELVASMERSRQKTMVVDHVRPRMQILIQEPHQPR